MEWPLTLLVTQYAVAHSVAIISSGTEASVRLVQVDVATVLVEEVGRLRSRQHKRHLPCLKQNKTDVTERKTMIESANTCLVFEHLRHIHVEVNCCSAHESQQVSVATLAHGRLQSELRLSSHCFPQKLDLGALRCGVVRHGTNPLLREGRRWMNCFGATEVEEPASSTKHAYEGIKRK